MISARSRIFCTLLMGGTELLKTLHADKPLTALEFFKGSVFAASAPRLAHSLD